VEPFDLRDGGDEFSSFEPAMLVVGKPNQSFTAQMRLLSPGRPEGEVRVSVHFYASADPVIRPSDYYLGQTGLSASGTLSSFTTLTLRVTFPTNIPRGTYYIGWIIDPGNQVTEYDEKNNTAYKSSQLLLVGDPWEGALYVDARAHGANDGSSWANALTSLQDALALARAGAEIHVAQGVYTPDRGLGITRGDRAATFPLASSVILRGGYAGSTAPDPDARDPETYVTVLSGDLQANDLPVADPANLWKEPSRADNSRHILTATGAAATAVLEGVQIRGGYAFEGTPNAEFGVGDPDPAAADADEARGAGLLVSGASLTLRHCTFSDNWASGDGGALYANDSARLELTDGTFRGNGAGVGGAPTPGSVLGDPGQARGTGGALRRDGLGQLILSGCAFDNNFAGSQGGALDNDQGGVTLIRCRFLRNHAGHAGGGAIWNSEGQVNAFGCLFTGNRSDYSGGAIANGWGGTLYAANCCLNGNVGKVQAGALDNFFGGKATLSSCTLRGNRRDGALAAITCGPALSLANTSELTIDNSILWDGGSEILDQGKSTIRVSRTNIQGGWLGLANLAADPVFVLPNGLDEIAGTEDDNLRLGSGSPCVDQGNAALVPKDAVDLDGDGNVTELLPFDLDGNPRVFGLGLDLGAYERQVPCGG
jgi:predicted outer membrane repeat protein